MDKFIRFSVTIIGMIIINVILYILGMVVCIITSTLFTQFNFNDQTPNTLIIIFILIFTFVRTPYSFIVTYVLYNGLSKVKTKKYGLLAGGFTQGVCSWAFNSITLPYYLISLKFPPKYEKLEAPPKNYTRNFITGWVFGLFICLILTLIRLILVSAVIQH